MKKFKEVLTYIGQLILTESDIVSLMASFSARLHGKRSNRNKNENNKK